MITYNQFAVIVNRINSGSMLNEDVAKDLVKERISFNGFDVIQLIDIIELSDALVYYKDKLSVKELEAANKAVAKYVDAYNFYVKVGREAISKNIMEISNIIVKLKNNERPKPDLSNIDTENLINELNKRK